MIYLVKTFTPRTFYSHLFIYQASGSDYVVCHMSHNRYIIASLCKLNEDNFESNILMNRQIRLLDIEIHNKSHGFLPSSAKPSQAATGGSQTSWAEISFKSLVNHPSTHPPRDSCYKAGNSPDNLESHATQIR